MKLAYADPPYLGASKRHYSDHPDHAVYDTVEGHRQLVDRLVDEFPDGWALSLGSDDLQAILPLCPDDVRVAAWVKPWTRFYRNVTVAFAWEPVIIRGGRKRPTTAPTVRDWIAISPPNVRGRSWGGLAGQKPPEFAWWLFEVLGMQNEDDLADLFPGTGAVSRAWEMWRGRLLFAESEWAVKSEPLGLDAPRRPRKVRA